MGDNVTLRQFAKWIKRWLVFVMATAVTTAQQPSYLMQAIGEAITSQVLAGFPGGIVNVPFTDLLAA